MTETDRAVDDAERAREQGGAGRWFRLSPGHGRLPAGRLGNRRRRLPDELGVLVVLALLVAGIGIRYPDFLDSDNLLSTAHNSVYISLMACGMVFALAMREVDLSVGGSYAMCLVVGALLIREGVAPWLAVHTDGPTEVQLFQNLTARAKDGIVLENLDPPIFTRPAARAVDQGIPIVALDTSPTDGSKVTFYVGNDNYALGELMAKETLKRLGDDPKGEIVVGVPNPGTPVLDNRAKGIADTFRKEAPGVKVLGPFQTYSDPGQNHSSWSSQVGAHPKALAFLGVGDADSYNLAKIKKEKSGKWLTAGFDVEPKTLDAVKDGSNFVAIDPQHFLKGYLSTAMLIESVRDNDGKLPDGWFLSPGGVVDSSNIDEIITRQKSPKAAYDWYKPVIDKLLGDQKAQLKPLKDAR